MHVTMVVVTSADGKMTHGDDPHVQHWSSKEDYAHFREVMQQHDVVVMGRKTYEAVRPKPQAERLRVVLTRNPDQFQDICVPGQLECSAEQPFELVTRLEQEGHQKLMLVGGGHIYAAFLQAHLVDEIFLTIEPTLFGQGAELLADLPLTVPLQLIETKQLNTQGTLLLHYKIA